MQGSWYFLSKQKQQHSLSVQQWAYRQLLLLAYREDCYCWAIECRKKPQENCNSLPTFLPLWLTGNPSLLLSFPFSLVRTYKRLSLLCHRCEQEVNSFPSQEQLSVLLYSGRLVPIQTQIKKDKCGIGAEMKKKREMFSTEHVSDTHKDKFTKRPKAISKRLRKMLQEEERMKEKDFDQAFFRDFWPDNV